MMLRATAAREQLVAARAHSQQVRRFVFEVFQDVDCHSITIAALASDTSQGLKQRRHVERQGWQQPHASTGNIILYGMGLETPMTSEHTASKCWRGQHACIYHQAEFCKPY